MATAATWHPVTTLKSSMIDMLAITHTKIEALWAARPGTAKADVTVKVRTSALRVFLLSAASHSPISSYAHMGAYGQKSLSPGVPMLNMKLA